MHGCRLAYGPLPTFLENRIVIICSSLHPLCQSKPTSWQSTLALNSVKVKVKALSLLSFTFSLFAIVSSLFQLIHLFFQPAYFYPPVCLHIPHHRCFTFLLPCYLSPPLSPSLPFPSFLSLSLAALGSRSLLLSSVEVWCGKKRKKMFAHIKRMVCHRTTDLRRSRERGSFLLL